MQVLLVSLLRQKILLLLKLSSWNSSLLLGFRGSAGTELLLGCSLGPTLAVHTTLAGPCLQPNLSDLLCIQHPDTSQEAGPN